MWAHRYLTADHLRQLAFPGASSRVVQLRLRKLYEHGLLERESLDRRRSDCPHVGLPIYTLGRRATPIVSDDDDGEAVTPIRRGRKELHVEHDLAVSDALVALTVACRNRPDLALAMTEPETALRRKLRARAIPKTSACIPDGAFTLYYASTKERLTFYLEVVHADPPGGTRGVIEKLKKYVRLHRQGFFRLVYGHDRLRAVIVATTTKRRAEHLATLAKKHLHGERLFWFGHYQEKDTAGKHTSVLTAACILDLPWLSTEGSYTLASPSKPIHIYTPLPYVSAPPPTTRT